LSRDKGCFKWFPHNHKNTHRQQQSGAKMYLQVRGKIADTVDKELLLTVFFQYFGIAYGKKIWKSGYQEL
jgi:hypothetical protein